MANGRAGAVNVPEAKGGIKTENVPSDAMAIFLTVGGGRSVKGAQLRPPVPQMAHVSVAASLLEEKALPPRKRGRRESRQRPWDFR